MRKSTRYLLLTISLWLVLAIPVLISQETETFPYDKTIAAIESFVKEEMALEKVPGISVGFIKDDFTWTKGFGFADLENKLAAKPESSFRLASITKTITAMAILQLAEAGKIDLDAEIQRYVPYFPRKKWPVTARLLLGNLGGISHYRNEEAEEHIKVHKNTEEAIAIFKDLDLLSQPGTRYVYSSYGFNLLGAAVEGASGMSYGEYIKKYIFDPLGMKNSRLDDPVDLIPHRVRGYRLINGELKNSEYVDVSSRFAAGGVRSTVVDLLKYARGIMDGKLLKEETWKEMFTSMSTRFGLLTGYGMGWHVTPLKGHFQVYHGGSQPETRTFLLILPKDRFAIVLLSNLERMNRMRYVRRLAELILDEDLDSSTYVNSREGQIIYNACMQVFAGGLSQFTWLDRPLSNREEDLARAFAYFNQYVDMQSLKSNFRGTYRRIHVGIHPISKQPFVKVGTFMASTLYEAHGKEGLLSYHERGPLSFFVDYIKISDTWTSDRRKFRFKKSFARLIRDWEKSWPSVYTDDVRHLFITVNTDFEELGSKLKQAFQGASLYPDFSADMSRVAEYLLEEDNVDNSFIINNLIFYLYPNSPRALTSLALNHLWVGNTPEARELLKKAYVLDPFHPSVSIDRFFNLARRLDRAHKREGLFALLKTAAEIYPKNAPLHKQIGDIYLRAGQREKAIEFYRKALTINPRYEEAKKRLDELARGRYR